MMKRVVLLGLLLLLPLLAVAEFPIFERPDATARWIGVTRQLPTADKVLSRHENYLVAAHLARRLEFQEIPIAPGRTGFVTPGLACRPDGRNGWTLAPQATAPAWHWLWGGFNLLLAAGIWLGWKRGKLPTGALAVIPAAVRSILTIWILQQAGEVYLFSSDEPDFFRTMQGLLAGQWSEAWNRTIGLPLLYAPFAAACGASSVFDLLPSFSFFNGFLLGPGSVALLALLAAKWLKSWRRGLLTAGIYAVLPLFFFHAETANGVFRAFFALPDPDWTFGYYKSLTWSGFNAMSDMPATVLLLSCGVLLAYARPTPQMAAWAGLLFGAAILVRLNAVFFAPYFWWQFHARRPMAMGRALAAGTGVLLLTVAGQLVINTVQFGAPWITPFVLHDRAAEGFRWAMLSQNLPALFGANLPWFAAGIPALLLLPNRPLRLLLGYWLLPTLFFFCGYIFTAEHTTRFILPLYGALIAAAVGLWPNSWNRRRGIVAILLVCGGAAIWYWQAFYVIVLLLPLAAARLIADTVQALRQRRNHAK